MMTDISRRRLLKAATATALGVSTASRARTPDAMEEIDLGQPTKPHKCSHGWFIARQDRPFTGAHAVDFWSQLHCNISHADHLPPEVARGVVWFEYPASRQLRDERAIGAVNSILKESQTNWLSGPRQFAEHFNGGETPPFALLLSTIGHENAAQYSRRTALIALNSHAESYYHPGWMQILPAIRACYDHVIGHFHLDERGFRQWRAPRTSSDEESFWKVATHCDAVILTSSALVETDLGLCAAASTEELVGELVRRLGYALLDRYVVDRITGVPEGRRKPHFLALGSATFRRFDDPWHCQCVIKRQSELVSGSFGAPGVDDLPLFIAISSHEDRERVLDPVVYTTWVALRSREADSSSFRLMSDLCFMVNGPPYQAERRMLDAVDMIALWPFRLGE
jgi:hypothetical protein